MIVTENLTKWFKRKTKYSWANRNADEIVAVDHVNIHIKKGEIYGLLGPNGAGKTTLVKMLTTLILPTLGTASVNGYDILAKPKQVRTSIGLVTGHERSFYFRLSGQQNLEFFGMLFGMKKKILKERSDKLLKRVGLYEARNLKFMKYSEGMRKKLSLVRALLIDPPVYLLDEPTAGIDPFSARVIRETIQELSQEGKTILLTTHDMHEAEKLCNRIGILAKGRLIREDTPLALRETINKSKIVVELQQNPPEAFFSEIKNLDSVSHVAMGNPNLQIFCEKQTDTINEVVRTIAAFGVKIKSINVELPSLEEAFISLTRKK
ncbi:MAG TPA: ATP-binding cassette domain-containing protein [Candidatus Atribacteria bacterium]|nr:ATP-binding cassette domain-containing protein [Candidatus Atribacteria bacterium]